MQWPLGSSSLSARSFWLIESFFFNSSESELCQETERVNVWVDHPMEFRANERKMLHQCYAALLLCHAQRQFFPLSSARQLSVSLQNLNEFSNLIITFCNLSSRNLHDLLLHLVSVEPTGLRLWSIFSLRCVSKWLLIESIENLSLSRLPRTRSAQRRRRRLVRTWCPTWVSYCTRMI